MQKTYFVDVRVLRTFVVLNLYSAVFKINQISILLLEAHLELFNVRKDRFFAKLFRIAQVNRRGEPLSNFLPLLFFLIAN